MQTDGETKTVQGAQVCFEEDISRLGDGLHWQDKHTLIISMELCPISSDVAA